MGEKTRPGLGAARHKCALSQNVGDAEKSGFIATPTSLFEAIASNIMDLQLLLVTTHVSGLIELGRIRQQNGLKITKSAIPVSYLSACRPNYVRKMESFQVLIISPLADYGNKKTRQLSVPGS